MPYSGGLFSAPLTTAVMDPYVDPHKIAGRAHGNTKGMAQFGISKRGIPGKFNRLYEGETFVSESKQATNQRMEGRKKFLTPNGFGYSSPIKKSSSKGDFYGTFQKKAPTYLSDGTYGTRQTKTAITESGPKNFYTNPPRKATGLSQATTPKTLFEEYHYVTSPYNAFHETEKRAKTAGIEKLGDKLPFKVRGQDALYAPIKGPPGGMSGSAPTNAVRKPKPEEEPKAFRPSSPSKQGGPIYGTFSKYPNHEPDPFDEKAIMKASMSGRLLPMATQFEGMDERIAERRPWTPSSPAKQMFTKSTFFSK